MGTMEIIRICLVVLAYIVGSIPTGDLIGKYYAGVEVLEGGSFSPGATNTLRVAKKLRYAFWVMVVDTGVKGWLMVFLAYSIFGASGMTYLVFAAALLGHKFSVFLKLKGGKCIATLIGGLTVFIPGGVFLLALVVLIIVFSQSKGTVSLSTVSAIATLLLGGVLFHFSWTFVVFAIFSAILIGYAHQENLKRIWRGKENRLAIKLGLDKGKISLEHHFIEVGN